jgi:DNA gyrase subunit A
VTDKDELMLITTKGQMVRTRVKEIRVVGRNTMGVKLMDLRGAEKLQAIAPVVSQERAEVEPEAASTAAEQKKRDTRCVSLSKHWTSRSLVPAGLMRHRCLSGSGRADPFRMGGGGGRSRHGFFYDCRARG